MSQGQSQLLMGDCDGPRNLIREIVSQMTIPLIQGTLRYAEICARTGTRTPTFPSKARAEGTAFAAALVPRIAACPFGEADADEIWDMMKHGSTRYDFPRIKILIEKYYPCLNVTCKEVGASATDLT